MTLTKRKKTPSLHLVCAALGILLTCTSAFAQVTFTKVGDPLWEPKGEFMTSLRVPIDPSLSTIENHRLFVSDLFGDTHVVQDNLEYGYLPAEPHDGPYDREFREVVAAAGGIDTNVFRVSDSMDSNFLFMNTTLVPSSNAPTGKTLGNPETPVIPNAIFPIQFESVSLLLNDIEQIGECVCVLDIPALSDYGVITDENGIQRDYTGLNWTHLLGSGTYATDRPTNDVIGDYHCESSFAT